MAIKYWLAYLYQQCAAALAVLCFALVAYEIALPGSILPYFNLHILVIATLVVCLMSPAIFRPVRWMRALSLIVLGSSFIAYLFLALWEGGIASRLVFGALVGLIVMIVVALCLPERSEGPHSAPLDPTSPSVPLLRKERDVDNENAVYKRGDTIKVIEVEEEISIFMN